MSKTSIACIVLKDDSVLIAHRNPVGQMGGRWEFPGGKVDPGEDDIQAVIREFREEFGVTVTVGERVADAQFVHNGNTVQLHAYRVFVPHDGMQEKYVLTEHSEYKWVSIEEIPSLSFVDSDMLLYPEVKNYVSSQA